MPYFSIIMPTKNRAHIICSSIESIINQTSQDWELIIIDDHSSDNTREMIIKYKNLKIKYFPLTIGQGPGAARDFGIKQAKGEIIVIADSDDLLVPKRLEITYDFLNKNQDIDVAYGNVQAFSAESTILQSCPFNANLLTKYNFIFNPAAAFKKNLYLKSSGYDTKISNSEDYDLWLTFLELGAKFGYINQILTKYRVHEQSQTKNIDYDKRKLNLEYVRKKHSLEIPNINETKNLLPEYMFKRIEKGKGLDFWFG